jgi:hypothetical protein
MRTESPKKSLRQRETARFGGLRGKGRRLATAGGTSAIRELCGSPLILQIEFNNGSIYDYFRVPTQYFEGLLSASSAGRYFHMHVKGRYRFKRVR